MRLSLSLALFVPIIFACAGTPEGTTAGECADAADNDMDGLADCDDPDCVAVAGCGLLDTASDADTDSDSDSDSDSDTDVSFSVDWDNSGATLLIEPASGTYLLGIAEETDWGWLGEDGFDGAAGAGRGGPFDINHDEMADGAHLSTTSDPDAVEPNVTTLVTATMESAGSIAYMLDDGSSCWEYNDSEKLYDCTEI